MTTIEIKCLFWKNTNFNFNSKLKPFGRKINKNLSLQVEEEFLKKVSKETEVLRRWGAGGYDKIIRFDQLS